MTLLDVVGWVVLSLLVVLTCIALIAVVIVGRARSRAIGRIDGTGADVGRGLRDRLRR